MKQKGKWIYFRIESGSESCCKEFKFDCDTEIYHCKKEDEWCETNECSPYFGMDEPEANAEAKSLVPTINRIMKLYRYYGKR